MSEEHVLSPYNGPLPAPAKTFTGAQSCSCGDHFYGDWGSINNQFKDHVKDMTKVFRTTSYVRP